MELIERYQKEINKLNKEIEFQKDIYFMRKLSSEQVYLEQK